MKLTQEEVLRVVRYYYDIQTSNENILGTRNKSYPEAYIEAEKFDCNDVTGEFISLKIKINPIFTSYPNSVRTILPNEFKEMLGYILEREPRFIPLEVSPTQKVIDPDLSRKNLTALDYLRKNAGEKVAAIPSVSKTNPTAKDYFGIK